TAIPAPEIAVEQPLGVDIADGGAKDFGSVVAGGSASLIFTIRNTGNADLTGLAITLDGVNADQFSVTANPSAPVNGPLGSTTFTVRFAPATVGAKNAALHIASNDSNENPFDITLTGSGTAIPAPEIAVEQPLGVDIADGGTQGFGPVVAGGSTSLVFTIRNTGTADLTGLGITIDGLDAGAFSVTSNPGAPLPGPTGFTSFTVRFAPATVGAKNAALHIASNDSNENPFDITLTGSGTVVAAPEIAVEQPLGVDITDGGTQSFGTVTFGSDTSLVFTIRNIGNADLTGLGITINGQDAASFSITSNPGAPVSGPFGFTTFTVRFAPATVGAKNAALHIANNDSNENPFDITLTGTGTGGLSVASISPITLNPQTGLFEQTVGVINLGSAVSTASRLQIQGLPGDVQVHNGSGFTNGIPFVQFNHSIAPGATVSLILEYYRLSRATFATPAFEAVDTTPVTVAPAGIIIAIDRSVRLDSGRLLIEFSTTPGHVYAIQYSSNLTNWVTVIPSVTAPSNKVQWYDDGPPKTESKPITGSRFYQVVEMP
ncbi:MAG TPA: choice-of-anchor D domain-containing protein, partial [Candidatus Limnocylindria bacterium]|nr:choice-of-anchor D domain-containing protein [Candidatus Limnocylindria bacterium]